MIQRLLLLTLLLFGSHALLHAQSYAFGVKGGLTVGTQKWEGSFEREALFRYHGAVFIESASETDPFGLFAQLGYHVKGSAIRINYFGTDGSRRTDQTAFEFNNLSLTAGAKQKVDLGLGFSEVYYMLGLRGDYNLSTDFGQEVDFERSPYLATVYPIDDFVNDFTFGLTVGGGLEIPFSELVGMVVELSVNPDFTKQYNQPEISNIINPNPNSSTPITIRERQIVNTTFELTVGFRFLHKIEYID